LKGRGKEESEKSLLLTLPTRLSEAPGEKKEYKGKERNSSLKNEVIPKG